WNDPGKRSSLAAGIADQLSIAVSQDGNWLAAGDRVGKVRVWNTATRELCAEFTARP
ncbi:MAG: hypothetical protein ACI9TH_004152, partial [Kiritimatiellia bacterium]